VPDSIYASGEETLEREASMGRGKKYQTEQVGNVLHQIEVAIENEEWNEQASRGVGSAEQMYHRSRKECTGLHVDQPRHRTEVEQENAKLKHLVAELSLDKRKRPEFLSITHKLYSDHDAQFYVGES
jgi:hypothetical protein